MIEIKDLYASIDDKPILKGLNLSINPGEIHAIMGPNGAGKSTLAKVLAGHPSYDVSGKVLFKGKNILVLEPNERAHLGLFMSFQYPVEIPGVSNVQFLKAALNANRKSRNEPPISDQDFTALLKEKMLLIDIKREFQEERDLNVGFSGGEKKRNEILQMAVLNPDLCILDETDSGLDIDAMRIVAKGVNHMMGPEKGLILITHYQRLLDYIPPNFVHVMLDGRIVESGGPELALELEKKGYDWLNQPEKDK